MQISLAKSMQPCTFHWKNNSLEKLLKPHPDLLWAEGSTAACMDESTEQ